MLGVRSLAWFPLTTGLKQLPKHGLDMCPPPVLALQLDPLPHQFRAQITCTCARCEPLHEAPN